MKKVIVYSLPKCPNCVLLKTFLDEHGVTYENINPAENREATIRVVERTSQRTVPVCEIDGEFIVGFDREKISQLLDLA